MIGSHSNIKEYSAGEMPELLRTEFLAGIIKNVNQEENKTSVLISGANTSRLFQNVDIFYHVPKDTDNDVSIEKGGFAFKNDDLVLVHKLDDTVKVIGFLDGLRAENHILFKIDGLPVDIHCDSSNIYIEVSDTYGVIPPRIIKYDFSGKVLSEWYPTFDFGGGANNLIRFNGLNTMQLVGSEFYFSGANDHIPGYGMWRENSPYGRFDEVNHFKTYNGVTVDGTYRIIIQSTTTFDCWDMKNHVKAGSGSLESDSTINGQFTLEAAGWSAIGTWLPGDSIDFTTCAGLEHNGILKGAFGNNSSFDLFDMFDKENPNRISSSYLDFIFTDALYVFFRFYHNPNNIYQMHEYEFRVRKFTSLTEFTEKNIMAGLHDSGTWYDDPNIPDTEIGYDVCHDGTHIYFHYWDSNGNHIVQYDFATDTKNDWLVPWLEGSYIGMITFGNGKLFISDSRQSRANIYQCDFSSEEYDSIICDWASPVAMKFFNDSLFILNDDGKVVRYKIT